MTCPAGVLAPPYVRDDVVDELVAKGEELDLFVLERRRRVEGDRPVLPVTDCRRELICETATKPQREDLVDRWVAIDVHAELGQHAEDERLRALRSRAILYVRADA